MKISTSFKISLIVGLLVMLIITGLSYFMGTLPGFYTLFILFVIVVAVSYFTFNRYIKDRLDLLYRTIQNQKIENNQQFNIEDAEQDVKLWIKERQLEVEHLKDTEQFRREFLGNVSHELKTPIFNIQGYVLTLLEGALEDEEINRKYLLRTQKSVERMISIVEDLENISEMEGADTVLKNENFDIVASCSVVMDALEDKAKQNGIRIVFNKEYKPIIVEADEQKINQVVINLLVNSIKYGNENGLTKVRFFDMGAEVLIEISDNGIGIDEVHLARLCERFYRVDGSRSREKGGTGLGLSIVKHIIESHQQTLNIRSTVGVGSTFSFTLKKAK